MNRPDPEAAFWSRHPDPAPRGEVAGDWLDQALGYADTPPDDDEPTGYRDDDEDDGVWRDR